MILQRFNVIIYYRWFVWCSPKVVEVGPKVNGFVCMIHHTIYNNPIPFYILVGHMRDNLQIIIWVYLIGYHYIQCKIREPSKWMLGYKWIGGWRGGGRCTTYCDWWRSLSDPTHGCQGIYSDSLADRDKYRIWIVLQNFWFLPTIMFQQKSDIITFKFTMFLKGIRVT